MHKKIGGRGQRCRILESTANNCADGYEENPPEWSIQMERDYRVA